MTNNEFIMEVAGFARGDARVLPSLTIAQAILESGWGRSGLTVKANALFGIKAGKSWKGKVYSAKTKECYDGVNFVNETAVFRAYDSWADSVADHTEFLCGLNRYKAVVGEKNYKKACEAIQAAGYATDPNYAKLLISLIEEYELYKYDAVEPTPIWNKLAGKRKTYQVLRVTDNLTKIAKEFDTTVEAIVLLNKKKYPNITSNYIQLGWTLDIPKTYTVKSGDTLSKIAKEYNTSINVIISVNQKRYKRITKDYIQAGWVLVV